MTTVPGVVRTYRKKPDSTIFYDVDFRSEDPGGFTPQLEADETLASYTLDVSPPGSITVIDDADQTGIENESKVVRIWTSGGTIGAIVIITVSIVTSGSVAKNFPARTYSRSIAILIAGVPVGLVDSNCCLPDEGDEGDVLTVVSGEWTSAPPIPGGLSAPEGGDDYKVAFGLSGDLEYADGVRVSTGQDAVLFGDNPSTLGDVRVSPIGTAFGGTTVLGGRIDDLSQSAPLIRWNTFAANALSFGDGTYTSQVRHYVRTGGFFGIYVATTLEYSFGATFADFKSNDLLSTGTIQMGSAPATTGVIRLSNNTGIYANNAASGADIALICSDASDNVLVGSTSAGSDVYIDVASGKTIWFRFAGGTPDYRFTSTFADFTNNTIQWGTNPAGGSAFLRGPANPGSGTTVLSMRNNGNSQDVPIIRWNALTANELTLGNVLDASVWVHVLPTGTFGVWNGSVQMFAITRDRIYMANSNTPPTTDPVGGGFQYIEDGEMKYRGDEGTVTTIGYA